MAQYKESFSNSLTSLFNWSFYFVGFVKFRENTVFQRDSTKNDKACSQPAASYHSGLCSTITIIDLMLELLVPEDSKLSSDSQI